MSRVTLKDDSTRLSSIGEIRWKVERPIESPKYAPIAADSNARQFAFARLIDDEFVIESSHPTPELEPLRLFVAGTLSAAHGWHISKILPIKVVFDDDTVIASDAIFDRYGVGETIQEAVADLLDNLFAYYSIVKEYTNEKRPANQAILTHLDEYIVHNAG